AVPPETVGVAGADVRPPGRDSVLGAGPATLPPDSPAGAEVGVTAGRAAPTGEAEGAAVASLRPAGTSWPWRRAFGPESLGRRASATMSRASRPVTFSTMTRSEEHT